MRQLHAPYHGPLLTTFRARLQLLRQQLLQRQQQQQALMQAQVQKPGPLAPTSALDTTLHGSPRTDCARSCTTARGADERTAPSRRRRLPWRRQQAASEQEGAEGTQEEAGAFGASSTEVGWKEASTGRWPPQESRDPGLTEVVKRPDRTPHATCHTPHATVPRL